jgi:flagellin
MYINTNVMALEAQHRLAQTSGKYSQALERLSSGLRINRAADDAAGLAVSEKLRAQVRGLTQASSNAQDGISMIQTAEGAMNETSDMLQRMRELSVQAANDTLSSSDRGSINTELQQLKSEVNAIATRTTFNGRALLTGSMTTTQNTAAANSLKVGQTLATTANAAVTGIDVSGAASGQTFTLSTDPANANNIVLTRASDNVSQSIAVGALGANGSETLDFSQLGVKLSLQADGSGKTIADTITDLTAAGNNTIATQATSGSANFQIGANTTDFINVAFNKVDISAGSGMSGLNTALGNFNTDALGTGVTVADAQALTSAVDTAITFVNGQRATLGAVQNRLTHTTNSLGVAVENLSASESRIRNADVATETTNMVTAQILTQAGESVLAQANSAPQGALSLLRGG